MKLKKLKFITTPITVLLFTLFLMPACNNNKESGKNSGITGKENEVTTEGKMTDQTGVAKSPGKKIGKAVTTIAPADKSSKMAMDNAGYYNYTETAPFFPGGQGSLESYISNNIEYPREAIDNEAEGTVYVMFTIDENGKVGNVKTAGAAIGYGLEEEAVRVVNNMSSWTPGMNKGKKIKSWYTLPITYRLEES